jgi:hypothetical protein
VIILKTGIPSEIPPLLLFQNGPTGKSFFLNGRRLPCRRKPPIFNHIFFLFQPVIHFPKLKIYLYSPIIRSYVFVTIALLDLGSKELEG